VSSSYRNTLNNWLDELDVKANRVLDIGGSQEQVNKRARSWSANEYLIADLPEPHQDSPKPDIELNLNLQINMQYEALESYIGYFDTIFCLEVFDYVWNPVNAFSIIEKLLDHGGSAWVTFPSIYPLHQPIEDDALRYMPGAIEKLASAVGLDVQKMIKRRPETDLLDQFYRAERLRAAKHQDHQFMGFIVELVK
jgi:SAM-dependent methyltransferase